VGRQASRRVDTEGHSGARLEGLRAGDEGLVGVGMVATAVVPWAEVPPPPPPSSAVRVLVEE
jgi:hypothetical protein